MYTFIEVEEARKLFLEAVSATPEERADLNDALGRTLAESVVSREAIPPFASSAMNGFSVSLADLVDPCALRPGDFSVGRSLRQQVFRAK